MAKAVRLGEGSVVKLPFIFAADYSRRKPDSAERLPFIAGRAGTAGRPLDSGAQLPDIDLELGNGAAQGIAVHAQLPGSAALVALVLL